MNNTKKKTETFTISQFDHNSVFDTESLMEVNGIWIPAIPLPFFTSEGLPFWKRLNDNNWRPKYGCGRIFDSLEDYHAHVIYKVSVYDQANDGSVS